MSLHIDFKYLLNMYDELKNDAKCVLKTMTPKKKSFSKAITVPNIPGVKIKHHIGNCQGIKDFTKYMLLQF